MIIAPEGFNATLAGSPAAMAATMADIARICDVSALQTRVSYAAAMPFRRLKITIKPEIVTLRDARAQPDKAVGTYVAPRDWNTLIDDPATLVIDTRNHFEVGYGSFPGAIDPMTTSFSEFPAFVRDKLAGDKTRPVAMYCTGGIRCEKATSLLLAEGFAQVYHLEGGILRYLQEIPPGESRWQGSCFIFDEREALTYGLHQADKPHPVSAKSPLAAALGSAPLK